MNYNSNLKIKSIFFLNLILLFKGLILCKINEGHQLPILQTLFGQSKLCVSPLHDKFCHIKSWILGTTNKKNRLVLINLSCNWATSLGFPSLAMPTKTFWNFLQESKLAFFGSSFFYHIHATFGHHNKDIYFVDILTWSISPLELKGIPTSPTNHHFLWRYDVMLGNLPAHLQMTMSEF